jgi:thiol-disulfide isomerase/thioredoxin
VALHDLKGSAVLLDFWATWCVRCWQGLKETQAISDWAAAEKLPVKVLAVNTMERGKDETLTRVQRFWRSQKFGMQTLLDPDAEVFKAFESPRLPSMVLISASGKILNYHEGLFPDITRRSSASCGKA